MAESFKPRRFGKFVLTKKIAVGGMAEIYKAESYGVDGFKKVAVVKKILPHCSADKDFVAMLVDEAKLSVLLSHTNIVQVYELGKVDDDYYISMEHIHGVNMRDILYRCRENEKKVPTDIAVFILSEICKGLDYAHRKTDENHQPLNIIHRDISPQNILISYEGEVKIGDFGIAKAAMNISHTMAGVLKGKIAYMSPEQALGKPLDHRTDIFSTGILLYEILSNKRLFTGESQFEVLKKIRENRIHEEDLPEDIPEELRKIVAKVLSYDRDKRYSNAGDLQTDLIRYLYSNYPDFTPRRLSEFIRDTFADLLKAERTEKTSESDYESLTSSVSITDAKQVDLVAAPEDATKPVIMPKTPPPPSRPKAPAKKLVTGGFKDRIKSIFKKVVAGAAVIAIGFGIYSFYPKIKNMIAPSKPDKEAVVEFSTLKVSSNPSGAKIIFDGKDSGGTTPSDFNKLEVGSTHTIKLELKDYKTLEEKIEISSKKPISKIFNLELITGSMYITSNPSDANIIVNGRDTGLKTPATIEKLQLNKDLKITLKKEGFSEYEQTLTLTTEKLQPFSAELISVKPDKASINISSTPSGATIILNGKKTGRTTPAELSDLNFGEYKIVLELTGYDSWFRNIDVKKADKYELNALLVKPTIITKPTTEEPAPVKVPKISEKGSMRITSTPSGAKIYVDGKYTGRTTPATIQDVAPGKHNVKLEISGYKEWNTGVNVSAGKQATSTASLSKSAVVKKPVPTPTTRPTTPTRTPTTKPAPTKREPVVTGGTGKIKIASSPSGASVFINSQYKGTTPMMVSVPSGRVKVLVHKEGKQKFSKTVNVKPNSTVNLTNIDLGNVYGELNLTSVPPRASVIFDGRPIPPKTPVTIRKVKRNQRHTITLNLDGYKPWTRSFNMTGNSYNLNAVLEKR